MSNKPKILFKLKFIQGPNAGQIYQVRSHKVILGRSPACDIILQDSGVSRKHLSIFLTPYGFQIINLQPKNSIKVNGQNITSSTLSNSNTLLQVGSSQIAISRFSDHEVQDKSKSFDRFLSQNRSAIAAAGVLLLALGLLTALSPEKIDLIEKKISLQQKESDERLDLPSKKPCSLGPDSYKESSACSSQSLYIKAVRDFRKGQYFTAIDLFQACLSLNPKHILCKRYYNLAQKKADEWSHQQILLGRRYLSQKFYAECIGAFQNVMAVSRSKNSKEYLEAKKMKKICVTEKDDIY